MKYNIKLNEEQMRITIKALEEFFRVRMNQFFDLADDLAFDGYDYAGYDEFEKNERDKEFNERINRRNDAEDVFRRAYNIASPGKLLPKSISTQNAIDIWHALRHEQYLANGGDPNNYMDTRSDKPFPLTTNPLPTVTWEPEDL